MEASPQISQAPGLYLSLCVSHVCHRLLKLWTAEFTEYSSPTKDGPLDFGSIPFGITIAQLVLLG